MGKLASEIKGNLKEEFQGVRVGFKRSIKPITKRKAPRKRKLKGSWNF